MPPDPLLATVRTQFLERAFLLVGELEASNDREAFVRTLTSAI